MERRPARNARELHRLLNPVTVSGRTSRRVRRRRAQRLPLGGVLVACLPLVQLLGSTALRCLARRVPEVQRRYCATLNPASRAGPMGTMTAVYVQSLTVPMRLGHEVSLWVCEPESTPQRRYVPSRSR